MDKIITEGKELGVYLYMMTGGEPLVRKADILRLAEKHNDVELSIYTNSTLIDEDFCKEVSYRYPGAEKNTIAHMSLTLHPGENLAIVGLNGAGKTTLVKLICGFLDPTGGRVLLNGQDIRQYNRRDYYKLFEAVFQDFSELSLFDKDLNELNYGESGELCMTGPSMMLHYSGWRGEELTEQTLVEHPDGNTWLHTGDEAYITEQGIVHILGRGEIKAYGDKPLH